MIKGQPFTVNGKSIDINFTKDECYAKKSGICPLEQDFKINTSELYKSLFRNEQLYCPSLLYELKKNGFNPDSLYDEICIEHHNDTDKYVVNEGRHRVCIAIKSGIEITAIVTEK